MFLSAKALRVLGALVEKDRTTPEYYPLSLNALMAACNQKSNRDPVMSLDEREVSHALEVLRQKGLALQSADGGRVAKYAHNVTAKLQVDLAELAVLAELMLRGPQTAGELRGRAERMHHFGELWEVEAALQRLTESEPPLVAKLQRQPGHKESRYRQLLGAASDAEPEAGEGRQGAPSERAPSSSGPSSEMSPQMSAEMSSDESPSAARRERVAAGSGVVAGVDDERVVRLEEEVRALRAEVAALWKELRSLTLQPEE